jgi:plastocyanin
MRKLIVIGAVSVAVGAAPPALAATKDVRIVKAGFSPTSMTVNAGDTVRWTNRDTANHQVVSDRGSFVSAILGPGKVFSFTFKAAGTYRYRDALEPAEHGTITVKGAPPSVSLAVSAPIIVYGAAIKLSGVVSSQKAGEEVTIWAQPQGQTSFVQVGVVMTATGGVWDFSTAPNVLTIYHVRSKGAVSQPVTVQVRPKITLLPSKRGYFYAKLAAAASFAGKIVFLQRRTAFGEWIAVQRFTLGKLSGKLFKIPKRKGVSTYRILLPADQVVPGYVESWSGTQTVRRK